jgi:redox-sensitive bicupin YhaK (pirin superfamily)
MRSAIIKNQVRNNPADKLFSQLSEPENSVSATRTSTQRKSPPIETVRKVASIQKYARLPVWPAWNGAFLFLLSKILPNSTISKLEETFGGRVCPNFFEATETSPFIMLVHHAHSFTSFDPLRFFQKKVILPEGFPSHPHRGFITLTYCIKGGMIHRDSLGCKQLYGAEKRHGGNVAQWLVAGAGMLHEEMWDVDHGEDGIVSKQELFQLWVNLPSQHKMTTPRLSLLNSNSNERSDEDTSTDTTSMIMSDVTSTNIYGEACDIQVNVPIVEKGNTKTHVLVGEYDNSQSRVETFSPMSILHVQMEPGSSWDMNMPSSYKTGILYMRQGSGYTPSEQAEKQMIDAHYTATLTPYGDKLEIEAGEDGADFMLLVGAPLYEPVQAQGSMVMNSNREIGEAYDDYSKGKMGLPWDHKLTDDEWMEHVRKAPSVYHR